MRISDWSSDGCAPDLREDFLGDLAIDRLKGRFLSPEPSCNLYRWSSVTVGIEVLVPNILEEICSRGPLHCRCSAAGNLKLLRILFLVDYNICSYPWIKSEKRSVGKECVSTCESWWSRKHKK